MPATGQDARFREDLPQDMIYFRPSAKFGSTRPRLLKTKPLSSCRRALAMVADGQGFESTRRANACWFSRPVPSTARHPSRTGESRIAAAAGRVNEPSAHTHLPTLNCYLLLPIVPPGSRAAVRGCRHLRGTGEERQAGPGPRPRGDADARSFQMGPGESTRASALRSCSETGYT